MLHYQVLILCLIYTASEVNLTYITMSMLQVGNRLWKTDFFFLLQSFRHMADKNFSSESHFHKHQILLLCLEMRQNSGDPWQTFHSHPHPMSNPGRCSQPRRQAVYLHVSQLYFMPCLLLATNLHSLQKRFSLPFQFPTCQVKKSNSNSQV